MTESTIDDPLGAGSVAERDSEKGTGPEEADDT